METRGIQYCFVVLLFFPFILLGQDQRVADSLKLIRVSDISDPSEVVKILHDIAFNSANADSMLHYSEKLIEFSEGFSLDKGLYYGYFQSGHAYRLKGDYSKALQSFLKSHEYVNDKKNLSGLVFLATGDVYSLISSHQNAVDYYNRAIDIFIDGNKQNLAAGLINLGDEYFNVESLDSALLYFQRAESICHEHELKNYQAFALGNIGLVYAKMNLYDSAEIKLRESITILEELQDKYPISVYLTYMADIYAEKEEFGRALSYAHQSLSIGIDEGLKEQIRDASMKLSQLYEIQNDFENAYKYQKRYIQIRDSINNEQVIQEIADLRTEFEVSQKQAEVDVLTAERKTQRVIGFSLMGGLALVLALAIIQYRNNRQKQKVNRILREQKTKLEELNQTKDRFFSIISHDLRGPVNAFHGVSRMIKFFVQQKQMGQLEELAEDIDQSVDRLSSLLDNLLNWAVQQQGNFPYVPEKIDIQVMTEDLVKTFNTMALSKEINLVSEVDQEIEAWADRNTTMTIVRNLVSNALKFTPQKGEVMIKARHDQGSILIQVIDNGVGIPSEKINDLFKLQAKKSTWGTDGEKGLGLGLQLVYDFVTLNQGEIEVESTPDYGTTFNVRLPAFQEVVVAEKA